MSIKSKKFFSKNSIFLLGGLMGKQIEFSQSFPNRLIFCIGGRVRHGESIVHIAEV